MATEIVTIEALVKELTLDGRGKGFISRRGLARLCGVSHTAINKLVKEIEGGNQNLPKNLKTFAGQSFEGGNQVDDLLASAIIKYYARKGIEQAQDIDDALGAIGLRTLIQKTLNYRPASERRLSQAEIIELCCLPVPSEWQRRFPQEYYEHLSRLTGLKAFGNSRPTLWAQRTKELVYDYLPTGIYEEVKRCKLETGSYDKLHQFLSADGLRILEQHHRTLLTLMSASSTIGQLKTLLDQSCTGTYQLLLLGR
jgi:P63C domain